MINHFTKQLSHSINPTRVRYIKLGAGGGWEQECLDEGIARIGFGTGHPERFALCESTLWDQLAKSFIAEGKDKRTASRFANELRLFFEDDGTTLWITFLKERLYWGFLDRGPAQPHSDGNGVWRQVYGGWCGTDLQGTPLSKGRLSGALTKLAAYRGTSCDVNVSEYVIRRINGVKMPEVERAIEASQEMSSATLGLVRMLTSKDFELLVDLVFSTSGWRRVGVVGGPQDTLDFDLHLPSTGERAFVQVKSETTPAELADYISRLDDRADLYSRMFYVYHSGSAEAPKNSQVTVIGPEQLATMVVDAGLVGWLIEKVS